MLYGGLKRVGYHDTKAGAVTWITGKVSTESSIEPDNTKTETTDGSVFGGGMASCEIYFLDETDYDTIEGFMTANTEKFWTFEFKDGHKFVTEEAINPFVRHSPGINARDGAVAWIMDFEHFSHIPLLDLTP